MPPAPRDTPPASPGKAFINYLYLKFEAILVETRDPAVDVQSPFDCKLSIGFCLISTVTNDIFCPLLQDQFDD